MIGYSLEQFAAQVEIGPNLLTFALALLAAIGSIGGLISTIRGNRQLKSNGGTSLRDSLDRVEHNTHATTEVIAPESAIAAPITPIAGIPVTTAD